MKRAVTLSPVLLGMAVLVAVVAQGARAEGSSILKRSAQAPEDQPGVDWFCPSLALDSTGTPHVSYWGKNVGDDLRYASWDPVAQEWMSEVVDDSPQVGQYTSLALDGEDHPHISYYNARDGDLKYAAWEGMQWAIQTVDSAGDVGSEYTSLRLDAAGNPHVSYYDATNGDLKYAYWDAGLEAWNTQVADSGGLGIVGTYNSLQLDSAGQPHISYYDVTNTDLKYASGHWDGMAWTWAVEVVESHAIVGLYTSLALSGTDIPRISYRAKGPDQSYYLKYAEWKPAKQQWDLEVVDSGPPESDLGRFGSLALDGAGHAHISYHDSTNSRLRYAEWDGTQWLTQTVDTRVLVLGATSLRLDSDDQPHIAYGEKTNSTIQYASWDPGLQEWVFQTAYSEEEAGEGLYNSLALDSSLNAHIAYYDKAQRDLKYASRSWDGSTPVWITETVDSEGRTGRYCSLVLGTADRPRIGYVDSLNLELTFARWNGTQWLLSVVQNSEGMGRYSSMALDAQERPHFASYGETIRGLAYAYWDGSQWLSTAVDTTGDCGWSTSIAVDAAGHPHISYTDAASDTLRYAHWDGVAWITQTVASIGPLPGAHRMGTSIALDSAGRPHIGYYSSADGSLGYASWDGTAWITETVDSGKNLGSRPSLQIDAEDRPHIGYYDTANGDVRYSRWDGGAWQTQIVDSWGDAGWYLSLALEPAAPYRPHLSYMERNSGCLKYAYWDGERWRIEVVVGPGPDARTVYLPLGMRNR